MGLPSRATIPLLASLFLVAMGLAWLMATPPGSAFDERAHYVKAIGVGQGQLRGSPPAVTDQDLRDFFERGQSGDAGLEALGRAVQSPAGRWQAQTTRRFSVPPELIDPNFGCTATDPEGTAACLDAPHAPNDRSTAGTYVGTYQPYIYLPAGLAIRLAQSPDAALRLGRAALLVVALALLLASVWLLWSPGAPGVSLVGLIVAVTPMVVFVSTVLSPSGPEIAGAVCFSASIIRLARGAPQPRWVWAAVAASGAVLASARVLGPAFVLLALVTLGLLVGPGELLRRARAGGAAAIVAGATIATAAAASLVWEFAYQPRPSPSGSSVLDALGPSVSHLRDVGQQAIGVFGALDAPMPTAGYLLWSALFVALTAAALAAGTRRDRVCVAALLLAAFGVTIVMSVVYREIGPLHGRYALPFLVLVPLWEGEILLRRREQLPASLLGGLVAGTFAVAAAVQLLGWWASARRFAVSEDGSWLFPRDASWSPPLGWWTWIVIACLAVAAYAAGAAVAALDRPRPATAAPSAGRSGRAAGGRCR